MDRPKTQSTKPQNFVDLRPQQSRPVQQVQAMPKPQKLQPKRSKWPLLIAGLLVIIIAGGSLLLLRHPGSTVPAEVKIFANFQTYYPSTVPAGYKFTKGSARLQNGVLFFSFSKAAATIAVSQQAIPVRPPDLSHLQGFSSFDGPFGKAAIGSAGGGTTVIALSSTTLISINSSLVNKDGIEQLSRSLIAIQN